MNEFWENPGTIPTHRIDADVSSLNKNKRGRNNSNNYRSIFLFDNNGKVWAKVACNRMNDRKDELLPLTQFVSQRSMSTAQVITTIRYITQCTLNSETEIVLAFIELTEALYTVLKALLMRTINELKLYRNIQESVEEALGDP